MASSWYVPLTERREEIGPVFSNGPEELGPLAFRRDGGVSFLSFGLLLALYPCRVVSATAWHFSSPTFFLHHHCLSFSIFCYTFYSMVLPASHSAVLAHVLGLCRHKHLVSAPSSTAHPSVLPTVVGNDKDRSKDPPKPHAVPHDVTSNTRRVLRSSEKNSTEKKKTIYSHKSSRRRRDGGSFHRRPTQLLSTIWVRSEQEAGDPPSPHRLQIPSI
jgi:hypothetical protein